MYVGKERSQSQTGTAESCFTRVGSGLTHKHYTWLFLARGKHFSLLKAFVNFDSKEFYNFGPSGNLLKHNFFVSDTTEK
jgi:hypothetical protein